MKLKIFPSLMHLEENINKWLEKNQDIEIKFINNTAFSEGGIDRIFIFYVVLAQNNPIDNHSNI